MNKFLNSIIGSWLKVYLTCILSFIVMNGGIRNLDWAMALESGLISVLPIVINYLNPNDTRYGSKKKIENFKPEATEIKD